MRKSIRISEGNVNNPLVLIASIDIENKNKSIRFDCSGFDGCYFKLTKKQCERLGNFLIDFSKTKNEQ